MQPAFFHHTLNYTSGVVSELVKSPDWLIMGEVMSFLPVQVNVDMAQHKSLPPNCCWTLCLICVAPPSPFLRRSLHPFLHPLSLPATVDVFFYFMTTFYSKCCYPQFPVTVPCCFPPDVSSKQPPPRLPAQTGPWAQRWQSTLARSWAGRRDSSGPLDDTPLTCP